MYVLLFCLFVASYNDAEVRITNNEGPTPPAPEETVEIQGDALWVQEGERFKDETGNDVERDGYPVILAEVGPPRLQSGGIIVNFFHPDLDDPESMIIAERGMNVFPEKMILDNHKRLVIYGIDAKLQNSVRYTIEPVLPKMTPEQHPQLYPPYDLYLQLRYPPSCPCWRPRYMFYDHR